VKKSDLMDAAWPGVTVEEGNLSVQIAALRKLLGPSPGGAEWIATIPRVGYRFVGATEKLFGSENPTERLTEPGPSIAVLSF
jgi:DNA-binding winged helix-turn-helix (wHTH) protein